jgi:Domain of unknown function (DUF4252)
MNSSARVTLFAVLTVVLTGCGMTAPNHNAGYADWDVLSWRDVDATMTLSLGPTVLNTAARFVDDDPAVQALLRSLDGVRIKIYEIEGDALNVAQDLNDISAELRQAGWLPVVLVREEGEVTHVLAKTTGQSIEGITVLTSDSADVVFVNIMGEIHPELFVDTMVALDAPVPAIDMPVLSAAEI